MFPDETDNRKPEYNQIKSPVKYGAISVWVIVLLNDILAEVFNDIKYCCLLLDSAWKPSLNLSTVKNDTKNTKQKQHMLKKCLNKPLDISEMLFTPSPDFGNATGG